MAEITIIADEGGTIRLEGEPIKLEPGHAIELERSERRTRRKKIIVPGPLKPSAQLIERPHDESEVIAVMSDEELALFGPGEPLTLELRGALDLDVGQLDELASQADRRGVAMVVRLRRDVR